MKLIFLILFLITNSFSIAIDKGWYEDTNENLTKIYSLLYNFTIQILI